MSSNFLDGMINPMGEEYIIWIFAEKKVGSPGILRKPTAMKKQSVFGKKSIMMRDD